MLTDIVEIEWVDACSRDGWCSIDEMIGSLHGGTLVRTLGYVVKETDEGFTVIQTCSKHASAAGGFFIPRDMITQVWRIK